MRMCNGHLHLAIEFRFQVWRCILVEEKNVTAREKKQGLTVLLDLLPSSLCTRPPALVCCLGDWRVHGGWCCPVRWALDGWASDFCCALRIAKSRLSQPIFPKDRFFHLSKQEFMLQPAISAMLQARIPRHQQRSMILQLQRAHHSGNG